MSFSLDPQITSYQPVEIFVNNLSIIRFFNYFNILKLNFTHQDPGQCLNYKYSIHENC